MKLYKFDLVHSEDLGILPYSGVDLQCCFNVYKRPAIGTLNKRKIRNRWFGSNILLEIKLTHIEVKLRMDTFML